MRAVVAIVFAAALAACASSNIQVSATIDQNQKTISAPPGNSLLLGPLKRALRSAGWHLNVNGATTRTVGTVGPATNLETGRVLPTRYRLALVQRQFDVCLTGYPMVAYDLSLIDNASGDEVLTMSGRDCTDLAARSFTEAISGNGYCASTSGRLCTSRQAAPVKEDATEE